MKQPKAWFYFQLRAGYFSQSEFFNLIDQLERFKFDPIIRTNVNWCLAYGSKKHELLLIMSFPNILIMTAKNKREAMRKGIESHEFY